MTAPEEATIIVAHPDDEVLWFSSAIPDAAQVIVAFQGYAARPGLGARRAKAMAELPFAVDALGLDEAGTFDTVNWSDPVISAQGLALTAGGADPVVTSAYTRNFALLTEGLAARLSPASRVFTHNPWGEYGHPDHVQLYRVLAALQVRIGFNMWVSGYVSNRTMALTRRYAAQDLPVLRGTPDTALTTRAMEVYVQHDCWTWKDDWTWPCEEVFLPAPLDLIDTAGVPAVPETTPLTQIPAPEIGPDNQVHFR